MRWLQVGADIWFDFDGVIENGTLPDPTKLPPIDNAPLKVVRRNNEEAQS